MPNYYPSWRYHPTLPARVVKDADEDALYGPPWSKVPGLYPEVTDTPPAAAPAATDTPPPAPTADESEQAKRAELHATAAAAIVPLIADIVDLESLGRVREREMANPKVPGGRKTVLKAIDDQIAALTAADE